MSRTLLLADDSVVIQKLVGLSFANEDVTLVTTDNGDDAIARAAESRPDLVLADVVMPGKNGYEVCEAIKQTPELSHVPVLLLTGTFEAFDEERARAVGSDGHITKPFEAQVLVDRVNELLNAPPVAAADSDQTQPGTAAADGQGFDFFDRDPARELVSAEPSAAAVMGAAAGHDQTVAIIPDEPAANALPAFETPATPLADANAAPIVQPPSLEGASVFDETAPGVAAPAAPSFAAPAPASTEARAAAPFDTGVPPTPPSGAAASGATTAPAGLDSAAGSSSEAPPTLELDDRPGSGDPPALDLSIDPVTAAHRTPQAPPPLDLEPLGGAEPVPALDLGRSEAANATPFDLAGGTPAASAPPPIDFGTAPAADSPPALDLGSSSPDVASSLDLGAAAEPATPALDLGPQPGSAAAVELGQADPMASLDLGTPPAAETQLADPMMAVDAMTPPPEAITEPDATTAPEAITRPNPMETPDPFLAADPAATVLADDLLAAPIPAGVVPELTPPAPRLDDALADGAEADANATLLAEDLFDVQPELSASPQHEHDAAADWLTSPPMQPAASALPAADLLESDPLADPSLGESHLSTPALAGPGSSFEDALIEPALNQAPGELVPEVGVAPELASPRPSVPDLTPMLRDRLHETLEKVAWEAFADLSDTIVRQVVERVEQIAWEAIPPMAEALIQEEIRRMKAEEE